MQPIPSSIKTLLKSKSMLGTDAPKASIVFTAKPDGTAISPTLTLTPSSVRVMREPGALAQRCTITLPNVNPSDPTDPGYYSPDRGDDDPGLLNSWHGVLLPGSSFYINMGYGAQVARVFTGEVDDVDIVAEPGRYEIQIDARDLGCRLVDLAITDDAGNYNITYTAQQIEDIVSDLLQRAGWAVGDITTEATGIAATVTFEHQTYADALEWAMEATGFELVIDELGYASFHYPTDRQPSITNQSKTLSGTTPVSLGVSPIVSGSQVVTDGTGATVYAEGTDYTMDYANGTIARIVTGAIADGATVLVDAVYAAWTYREGEDIFRASYRISRRNVYGRIRVTGASPYQGTYDYSGGTAYGIPATKVLFSDISELDSDIACQAAADQMGNDMIRQVRQISFAAVANPWLQLGDCIQVIESSSTVSEIYRIMSMDLEFDAGQGLVMAGTAYYYGYAPLT